MKPIRNIFDLHCDTITECKKLGLNLINDRLHVSLDKLPAHTRLCQCMAVFIKDTVRGEAAFQYFCDVYAYFCAQLRRYRDCAAQVRDTRGIGCLLRHKQYALLLTVEGGSALGGKLENLQHLHRCGVKMMTLTWNGANELSGGAATDEGFTPFGRAVVKDMERLGMVVDVSHLSDRAFWELCGFAGRPFVASHSNARAVCDHRRNLTDDMFREIVARGGLVGINFYPLFVTEEGHSDDVGDLVRHVFHFLELGGEDVLALGSDFDGADMPPYLTGPDCYEYLYDALLRAGIPAVAADKLFYENARRFFEEGTDYAICKHEG